MTSGTSPDLGIGREPSITRRGFLDKMRKLVFGMALTTWFPTHIPFSSPVFKRRVGPDNLGRPQPDQAELQTKTSPESGLETEKSPDQRQLRAQKLADEVFASDIYPRPELGLRMIGQRDNTPQFTSASDMNWGGYDGRLITREKIPPWVDSDLSGMGVKCDISTLLEMMYQRYRVLLNNPRQLLSDPAVLDPTQENFLTTTDQVARQTGFPVDVIRAIWWRESYGNGRFPGEMHGNPRYIHDDGPTAVLWPLYHAQVNFDGGVDYSGVKRSRLLPASTDVFAFPADLKAVGRRSDDIVVTHIPVTLARTDPTLNLLAGLVMYYQSCVYTLEDQVINPEYQKYLASHPEGKQSDLFWSFAYAIYHRGGIPAQRDILNMPGAKRGFDEFADQFLTTLKVSSWDNPYYVGRSNIVGDPAEDKFFYVDPPIDRMPELDCWSEVKEMLDSFQLSRFERINSDYVRNENMIYAMVLALALADELKLQGLTGLVEESALDTKDKSDLIDWLVKIGQIAREHLTGGKLNFPLKGPDEPLLVFTDRLQKENKLYQYLCQKLRHDASFTYSFLKDIVSEFLKYVPGINFSPNSFFDLTDVWPDQPVLLLDALREDVQLSPDVKEYQNYLTEVATVLKENPSFCREFKQLCDLLDTDPDFAQRPHMPFYYAMFILVKYDELTSFVLDRIGKQRGPAAKEKLKAVLTKLKRIQADVRSSDNTTYYHPFTTIYDYEYSRITVDYFDPVLQGLADFSRGQYYDFEQKLYGFAVEVIFGPILPDQSGMVLRTSAGFGSYTDQVILDFLDEIDGILAKYQSVKDRANQEFRN